jgi:hypothetical protein
MDAERDAAKAYLAEDDDHERAAAKAFLSEPDGEPAKAPEPPAHEVSLPKAMAAHFLDSATLGGAHKMAQLGDAMDTVLPGGPGGQRDRAFQEALTEGSKQHPWGSAAADLGGFFAGPAGAVPGVLGLAGKLGAAAEGIPVVGKLAPFVARGLAGAGFGGVTSGTHEALSGGTPEETLQAAEGGAKFGGAAMAAPLATAAGLGVMALGEDDPARKASLVTNAVGLGLPGTVEKLGLFGDAAVKPAETARAEIARRLIKELLPEKVSAAEEQNRALSSAAKERFKTLQSSTESVPDYFGQKASEVEGQNKALSSAAKERFKTLQSATESVPDYFGQKASEVEGQNKSTLRDLKAKDRTDAAGLKQRFRLLQASTSPVGGAPGEPAAPLSDVDLGARAQGKMGAEIQDLFRFLRSKDQLKLSLKPEAEAGAQSILPDYEAQANAELGKYAQGKEARLAEILASLREPSAETAAKRSLPLGRPFIKDVFPNPELLPTSGALKPNPLAGFDPSAPNFTPAAPPSPRSLEDFLGSRPLPPELLSSLQGLKPNPLAGVPLASVPPSPRSPEAFLGSRPLPPELLSSLQGLKPNPLAGVPLAPVPTAESIAPEAAAKVPGELARLKAQQGIGSRLAVGAVKGAMNPLGAVLAGGGALTGRAEGLPAAGLLGAGRALINDPVLATSVLEPVGKALQASKPLAQRVGGFLAGAQGVTLRKKIEFLMKNDPEFRKAVEEASHGP